MEILAMDDRSIEIYKNALENGKENVYDIRLMVVGPYGVGKTSLINRLLKCDISKIESTDSIDVHRFRCGVTIPEGKWILSGDGVEEMKNHDLRLGRVVTTHKPQTHTKDNLEAANKATEETTDIVPPSLGDTCLKQESTDDIAGPSLNAGSATSPSTNNNQAKENLQRILDAFKSHDPQRIIGEVSVWDFGGQFTFYSTHQTFLTPRAVYLLVVNIAKNLIDEFKDDDCRYDISGIQFFKMGEYTVFWLKSIHTYGGDDFNVPPVILVATHLDELQGDKEVSAEKFFCDLRRHLKDSCNSMVNHLADEEFSVDNTKAINDPVLEQLRSKIFEVASKQKYWGEEIPASWIALEKKLMENQVKERRVISFQDVVNMAEDLEVLNADQTQLDLFLRFQHALGNILYFSEIGEFVILEVQWLIDAIKSLITVEEKFALRKSSSVIDKWKEFSNYGILRDELIDAVWKDKQFSEFKGHLLQIMEKLDIIAKPVVFTREEEDGKDENLDYFLVPCMVKESLTEKRLSEIIGNASSTPYLCIVFKNNFVPPAVFHKLLAACMKEWHVGCQGKEKKLLLFCGCGIFDIVKARIRFMICLRDCMIKLQVHQYHSKHTGPPQSSKCVEIKNFVKKKLKEIFSAYQQSVPYELYISCDLSLGLTGKKGLLPVKDLLDWEEVGCDEHEQVHCISSIDRLKYWFDEAEYQHLVQEGGSLGSDFQTTSSSTITKTHVFYVEGRRSSVKDTNCSNKSDQVTIQVKQLYTEPGKSSNISRGENFRKLEEAALPYEEIYNIVQQGVCNQIGNIHLTDDGQGTGFRVGSEYIMSAYHVFQPRLDSLWRKLARLVQSKLDKDIDTSKYANTLCHYFGEKVTEGDKEEMTKICIQTWRLSKHPNRTFQHLIQLFEEAEHRTLPTEIMKFFEKNSEIGEITFGQFKRKGDREAIFKLDYEVPFYSEADDVILVRLKGIPEALPKPLFLETTVESKMYLIGHPDDKPLQIDSGCQVYTNYDLMTLKRDIDEAKSKYPPGTNQNRQDTINAYDDVYQRFVEGKHVVFHLSRSIAHGASGSPGIIMEGSKAKVQLMLLAGHPGHVYNTLRKNEIESLPAKCLFESGISMKRVKELLLTEETKSICDDVFKMYEEDMNVD